MFVSAFELFKVGIGPSSSHTVGPMRAAKRFVERLAHLGLLTQVRRVSIRLHGSLAHTGRGHGTDVALMLGLEGSSPDTVDVDQVETRIEGIVTSEQINLLGDMIVRFIPKRDIIFDKRKTLKLHSNGMLFSAIDSQGDTIHERTFFSIGGGFIVNQEGEPDVDQDVDQKLDHAELDHPPLELEAQTEAVDPIDAGGLGLLKDRASEIPHPFKNAAELLQRCQDNGLSISSLMLANEIALKAGGGARLRVQQELVALWEVMKRCIERGCEREGILPGGLRVKRRAASLYRRLRAQRGDQQDPMSALDWVNLWALAVNEENAAGGRVVTAPTNGAAGIIPAVISYYLHYIPNADDEGVARFLLTAAAIGGLYKMNASISGAEVGCQGEVGVACSMAAGALAEVMGGTPEQVCNAAEIGMEHNLGLTCDPWGGLVQVPCIERNAMGAVKAINAARLALSGDGSHKVSLDKVIETMRRTGADMSSKYKETARGGLALTVIEC